MLEEEEVKALLGVGQYCSSSLESKSPHSWQAAAVVDIQCGSKDVDLSFGSLFGTWHRPNRLALVHTPHSGPYEEPSGQLT